MTPKARVAAATFVLSFFLADDAKAVSPEWSVNPQIGMNMSLLTSDPTRSRDSQEIGFQAGAFARYGTRFYFQPGLFFQRTSVTVAYTGNGSTPSPAIAGIVDTRDIYLPLLIGARFFEGRHSSIRATIGPAATFVLAVSDNIHSQAVNGFVVNFDTYTQERYSLVFGAGVDIGKLTLDANYDIGISRIFRRAVGDPFEPATKERVFRLSSGWLW